MKIQVASQVTPTPVAPYQLPRILLPIPSIAFLDIGIQDLGALLLVLLLFAIPIAVIWWFLRKRKEEGAAR